MSSAAVPDGRSSSRHLPDNERLGGKLVKAGIVGPNQLRHALEIQERKGGKLADILVHLGALDAQRFLEFLARQPGTPSISLKHCRIQPDIISLISMEVCEENDLIPIDRMGRLLTVGMVCPLDTKAVSKIEEMTGLSVKPMLCSSVEVKSAIKRYYVGFDI